MALNLFDQTLDVTQVLISPNFMPFRGLVVVFGTQLSTSADRTVGITLWRSKTFYFIYINSLRG